MRPEIKEFMDALKAKTVGEAEFHQAVEEVIETVWDTYQANPKYKANKILDVECNWTLKTSNHTSLETKNPIYTETPEDSYFQGSLFVKLFFDRMWALLIGLNNDGILV